MTSVNNEEYIKKNKVVTVDDDQNTLLHYAAALGNYKKVEEELAKGHKKDPENYLGWTPLMMAVRNCQHHVINLLLDHEKYRSDATKTNKYGASVFLLSVASGDLDIVKKILDHLLCGGVSRQYLQRLISPISLAIIFQNHRIFKYLIERSFDINAATPFTGMTPLMFAAATGNNKFIKGLMEKNADCRLKNYIGFTAPDMTLSRSKPTPTTKEQSKPTPLIIISSNSPSSSHCFQLTPLTAVNAEGGLAIRKSSEVGTPVLTIFTPTISPITPSPVFFPPGFSPGQFNNVNGGVVNLNNGNVSYVNHLLNSRINEPVFISPVTQPVLKM